MKQIMQFAGAVLIAAAAVLIIIGIYTEHLLPKLKTEMKQEKKQEKVLQNYEKAVLSDPKFVYLGETSRSVGETYLIFDEIQVTDSVNRYERMLKEAMTDEEIFVRDIQVLDKEGNNVEGAVVDAQTGKIRIMKAGKYHIRMNGMNENNRSMKIDFLISVNRKEKT